MGDPLSLLGFNATLLPYPDLGNKVRQEGTLTHSASRLATSGLGHKPSLTCYFDFLLCHCPPPRPFTLVFASFLVCLSLCLIP